MNHLSGLLTNGAKWKKRTLGTYPGFFLELAAGSGKRVLACLGQSFGDGPRTSITSLPERAARVSEEQLEATGSLTIKQQTRTGPGGLEGHPAYHLTSRFSTEPATAIGYQTFGFSAIKSVSGRPGPVSKLERTSGPGMVQRAEGYG